MNARLPSHVLNRSFSTNSTGGDKNSHNRIHKSNNAILVGKMKNSQYPYPSQRNFSSDPNKVQANGKSGVGDSMKPTAISKSTVQPILNLITKPAPSPQTTIGEIVGRRGNNGEISALVSGGPGQYTHPFFALPETIRVKIFKYLTHTERLLAQFVCRRFRNDIRLRAGLRTKITEETVAGLAFLRDVLVMSIIVGKYDRPVSGPSKLICNCDNIQELIFEEPICTQYLDGFLNRCRKVKWLIIRTTVMDTAVFPPAVPKGPYSTGGNEWRSVEMIHKYPVPQNFLKELILCVPGQHCLRTVNRAVAVLNTPSLERFSLMVNQAIAFEETTAVHFAVLNYLKNCLNVSHVIICTEQKPSTLRYSNRSGNVQLLERELNQYVENLHLKSLVLTEPAVAFETWNIVLNNQNSLEVFQVLHMTIWPLLRDIVIINAKSLVKVALHAILWDKYGKHSPIDLNVFSRSANLKELYICVAPPAVDGNANKEKDKGQVDFVNFHKLPKLLEILALKHCHLNEKEFLNIRSLTNLKSLGVVSLVMTQGSCIGIKTLRRLLHVRSLDELFISGLFAEGPDVEDLKDITDILKARVKEKRRTRSTFHSHNGSGNRWSVNKNGSTLFTIFSNWGFITY